MSLILEALRKSEAERQAASLPGLIRSDAAAQAPRQRRPSWLGWLPLVLLLLLAGLGMGWWGPRWLAQERSAREAPAAEADGDAGSAAVAPARPPNERAQALAQQVLAQPEPATPGPLPAPRERAAADAKPAPPPAQTTVSGPAHPAAASPATPLAAEPVPDAVSLALMPSAQRQQLPALKLSVHVFNPDPARRFAIVDGRRVQEGDALGTAIRVQQIRRDGLLLQVEGRGWLLEAVR
jgi:general secretion pathway protein B